MAWVSPRTWTTGEIVTAAIMNTHVRDNFLETSPAKATAAGDIFYATAANAITRLAKGTARKQLAINSGETAPEWVDSLQTLLTAQGDIIYASAANTPAKLAKGTARKQLAINSGETAPEWVNSMQSLMTAQGDIVYASSANTPAKLAKGTAKQVLAINAGATAPEWSDVVETADYLAETTVTQAITSLPSTVTKGQFKVATVKGNTVTNRLSDTVAGCEATTGWDAGVHTLVTDSSNEFEGTNCLKATITSGTTASIIRDVLSLMDTSKYYLITMYTKNGNATSIKLQVNCVGDGGTIVATANTSTSWTRGGVVIQPSDFNTATQVYIYTQLSGAVGQYAYFDAIMLQEITSAEYALGATALMLKYNWHNGTKSTFGGGGRVTATNKNIWGSKKAADDVVRIIGNSSYSQELVVDDRNCFSLTGNAGMDGKIFFLSFVPSTQYTIQVYARRAVVGTAGGILTVLYTDGTVSYINPSNATWTMYTVVSTVGKSISHIMAGYADVGTNYFDYDTLQVAIETSASDYVEHTSTTAYIPAWDGKSLPNGVKDSRDLNTGVDTQRTEAVVLVADDITTLYTGYTNVDTVNTSIFSDIAILNASSDHFNVPGWNRTSANAWADSAQFIGKTFISGSGALVFTVAKGTYANLAAAKAALAGTTLIYQLATPVVTKIKGLGQLVAEPNGTVSFENIAKDELPYNSGITIPDANYPFISTTATNEFLKLQVITTNDDNSRKYTDIALSTVTIAGGLTSFTSTALANGDLVYYERYYSSSLGTIPSLTYSYCENSKAETDSAVNMAAQNSKEIVALNDYAVAHVEDYTSNIPYGGTTTNTGNAYVLAAPVIAVLATGMAVSFKCNANATGAVTLNWSGMGAKSIKKGVGSDVTNLKNGSIYTVRYSGINFILQGSDSAGDATAANVLVSKTCTTDAGDITGTMPNNAGDVGALAYHVDGTSLHIVPAEGFMDGVDDAVVITVGTFVAGNIKNGVNVFGLAGTYITTYAATGANNVYSETNELSAGYGSPTKVREITVLVPGVYKISFSIKKGTDSAVVGQIYVNGMAVGVARVNDTTSYVEYSEDITVATTDEVQLYVYGGTLSKTQNFKFDVATAFFVKVL